MRYSEWKAQREGLRPRRMELERSFNGRAAGNRPRDPVKEKRLAAMDRRRLDRYIECGKIEIIGPRKWIWHAGPLSQFEKDK
jgi:hypothetical protein